ncbi:protein STICHEL-like 3 isoform X2 [Dioscorea cayenensis subsp. rotundata]|nr:protein STICHEL-like 3 isoform X2 [Dioscorea cayenensis subsp. rotundata]
MTRATRGGYSKGNGAIYGGYHDKDECKAISDHLRNHVHLTNCIHLRNHMHRHSPVLAERSLVRDLIVLQRSRSLRDPSTSPLSWLSPSIVGMSGRRPLRDDGLPHSGRRSLVGDANSPRVASVSASKVAAVEEGSNDNTEFKVRDNELSKREQYVSRRKSQKSRLSIGSDYPSKARDEEHSHKGSCTHSVRLRTLADKLEGVRIEEEDERRKASQLCEPRRHVGEEKLCEAPKENGHGQCNGLKRRKKRKFKSARRTRAPTDNTRGNRGDNDQSVASNSLSQHLVHQKSHAAERPEENTEVEVNQAPRNGCGIPWNWSRIHYRGKSILDLAGRSLSCGLSDSRMRKANGATPQRKGDTSNIPIDFNHLSSSTYSDSESLPLITEPHASEDTSENPALALDYLRERELHASHALRHGQDLLDHGSETRSGHQQTSRGSSLVRHRCLTQKYMPKAFKDLVGQNLAVQALSNAVLRRKVGLVYVFYGPHGTGKTSCARIFAKALNCQSDEHLKPCDICKFCISHNLGKSRTVIEIGSVGNFDIGGIMDILDSRIASPLSSHYRVFIFDDCDTLPTDSWSGISKAIDRAPGHVVFVLVSSNLDKLPHLIISRSQKFFFPKLKDSDIIQTLQWIATSECLEIDKDALKLIASRSDGSLRDAEMTLDQLSLLGQRITLSLVQELVGLVSDEKLVDLLDTALSADTVRTVKRLREIMETGVEPLALMSQLAAVITDILAGSYIFTQERLRRRFFRKQNLSNEDMEKLRQALKTLSEAEKQLRMSNDKLTWLTAALLQLAPDDQYMFPVSSQETSLNHTPTVLNNGHQRDVPRDCSNAWDEVSSGGRGLSRDNWRENQVARNASNVACENSKMSNNLIRAKRQTGSTPQQKLMLSTEAAKVNGGNDHGKNLGNEQLWEAVLDHLQPDALKQFVSQEGKLISVNLGAAPTVHVMFSSQLHKSKAEKFRGQILQAFECVLSSSVTLEIRYETRKEFTMNAHAPLVLPSCENGSSQMLVRQGSVANQSSVDSRAENCIRKLSKESTTQTKVLYSDSLEMRHGEVIKNSHAKVINNIPELNRKELESGWLEEASSSHRQGSLDHSQSERRESGEPQRQSIVRSRVSLADVIQNVDGCAQGGWSSQKAVSIAEKLEQENLRLESRYKNMLCWRVSRIPRRKLRQWRVKKRKPHSLLKLVTCGKCLSVKSNR